jgi:hypothetical protein
MDVSTTMDIYAQHVPACQRRAVTKTMEMARSRQVQKDVPITFQNPSVFADVKRNALEFIAFHDPAFGQSSR